MVSLSNHERTAIRQAQGDSVRMDWLKLKGLGPDGWAYCATHPPSITSSLPVMNDASSDARYSTP